MLESLQSKNEQAELQKEKASSQSSKWSDESIDQDDINDVLSKEESSPAASVSKSELHKQIDENFEHDPVARLKAHQFADAEYEKEEMRQEEVIGGAMNHEDSLEDEEESSEDNEMLDMLVEGVEAEKH